MKTLYQSLLILGSLGVFLYGMRLMSDGLQSAAGSRLKKILAFMTANRFAGVASGFLTTAIIQSSSATTVMVVGFVEAGLLTLRQSIGVIMGANIGTTVTGWIVAILGFKFSITAAALPAVAIGSAVVMIRKLNRQDVGEMLIGFGLLFLGLGLLKDSVPDISKNPEVLSFLARFTDRGFLSFAIFVLAGTLITIVVQSSSAAMAITLTMTFAGWIDFPTAAAVILGENIGTTVTAFIASLNAGTEARRAARAHMLFNLIGVLWISVLFRPCLSVVDLVVPGPVTGRVAITAHLAMFHTLFNVLNTGLCIGFVRHLEWLVERLVPQRGVQRPEAYHFTYVRSGIQETVELNIVAAQHEIAKMSEIVQELFRSAIDAFELPGASAQKRQAIESRQELVTDMHDQIASYLIECSQDALTETMARNVNALVRIVTELESIADSCGKLAIRAERHHDKKTKLDSGLVEEIRSYADHVDRFLGFNAQHLQHSLSEEEYGEAARMEETINDVQDKLKKSAQKRLKRGSSVKAELFYIDILRHVEHIGDFSLAISEALTNVR